MERAEELLERIAVGVEKLGEEPEFEIPTSPPICPHCGTIDPLVAVHDSPSGHGKMSGYFLKLTCISCNTNYFVVPQGWVNFNNEAEIREFFERAGNGTNGNTTN